MYKKTLLSLAIASTLTLTGCLENDKDETENTGSDTNGLTQEQKDGLVAAAGTYPIWNPALSELPIPNDLIFDTTAGDGSFSVSDTSPPVTTALNSLSGASTTAPIDIAMSALIDSSTLNSAAIADLGAGPNPNPFQNVFLLELDYASGSPLQGLSAQEPPTVIPPTGVDYTATEIILDGTSYIRINPIKPLKPNTRYVVAITNEIKDSTVDNAPIQASPSYKHITGSDTLLAGSLEKVRALTNGLWEAIAVKYFDLATNQVRTAIGSPALTEDNIALSYSFTTSGDEKVLNYIADPAQWFDDQITTFVGVSTATAVVGGALDVNMDGTVDYTDVSLSVAGALAAFPVNPSDPTDTTISDALAPLEAAFPLFGCTDVTAGPTYISCIGAVLANLPSTSGGFADLLPTPAGVTVDFDDTKTQDIYEVSSLAASLMQGASVPPGTVSVAQGTLTIPYYLGVPSDSGTNGIPLITNSWTADEELATAINATFYSIGLELPQGRTTDPETDFSVTPPTLADFTVAAKSSVVNYIFPFPMKTDDVTIPILGMYPTTPAGIMKTAIFQHGVQTDRSAAIAFGSSLVAGAKGVGTDVAVIAIDQPLHGIGGFSPADQASLATTLLTVSGTIDPTDGIDATEQATIDGVVAGQFAAGIVAQIDTPCPFIDIATDGISQAVADTLAGNCDGLGFDAVLGSEPSVAVASGQLLEKTVANGGSILPGLAVGADTERHFGFTSAGSGQPPAAMDYSGDKAANGTGSMYINLTSFLTSRDNIREQVLDLLTLRKSVGTIDITGDDVADLDANDVYFFGHSLGTLNGIPFVAVANDSTTTTDDIVAANMLTPGAGVSRLLENSPVFSPAILGGLAAIGLTQDTSSFQAYVNVLQASVDSTDPANFVQDFTGTTPVLFTQVNGDTYIPNSLDETSEVLGAGSISFSSGTEPLAVESSATSLTASAALGQNIVRFTEGNHTTPSFPSTGTTEEAAAFAEMVGQGVSIVVSGGAGVTVTNTTVIQTTP